MGRKEMKILLGLRRNVNALNKKMSQIDSEHNISFQQFMILETLYSNGDMSVRQVKEKVFGSLGTIYLIVDKLVKRNYIEKRSDEKTDVCVYFI